MAAGRALLPTEITDGFISSTTIDEYKVSELPEWIDERLVPQLNNKLTQQHVVETMLDAERPFFSIRQLQSRLHPDVGKGTVRNRLNESREIDVKTLETH